ncbi:hypothetical protein QTN25_008784 [Entamoeba marina]
MIPGLPDLSEFENKNFIPMEIELPKTSDMFKRDEGDSMFISFLPSCITELELSQYITEKTKETVKSVYMLEQPEYNSKFAFVTMNRLNSVQNTIELLQQHLIYNNKQKMFAFECNSLLTFCIPDGRSLLITNIRKDYSPARVKQYFEQYGELILFELPTDRFKIPRGEVYLKYRNKSDVDKIMSTTLSLEIEDRIGSDGFSMNIFNTFRNNRTVFFDNIDNTCTEQQFYSFIKSQDPYNNSSYFLVSYYFYKKFMCNRAVVSCSTPEHAKHLISTTHSKQLFGTSTIRSNYIINSKERCLKQFLLKLSSNMVLLYQYYFKDYCFFIHTGCLILTKSVIHQKLNQNNKKDLFLEIILIDQANGPIISAFVCFFNKEDAEYAKTSCYSIGWQVVYDNPQPRDNSIQPNPSESLTSSSLLLTESILQRRSNGSVKRTLRQTNNLPKSKRSEIVII